MLKIRLQRVGRKHEPVFRVVLTDSQNSTKSGKLNEVLGSYDPRHKESFAVKADRVKYWLSKGAKLTDTLHNMFVSKKIIDGKKINVLPKKKPIVKEADAKATASASAPATPAESAPAPVPAPVPAPEEAPAVEAPVSEETPAEEIKTE